MNFEVDFAINDKEKFIKKYNKSKIYDQNIKITKNNFEILTKKDPNIKDKKDKIIEQLLLENNLLKNEIISKDNQIKQLNIDKSTYNGWDSSKYQDKIKELESKLKDCKSIKGQLTILKFFEI